MSTVMYTFKVPKASLFKFCDSLRAVCLESRSKFKKMNDLDDLNSALDLVKKHESEFIVNAQVFELKRHPDIYFVRILEGTYLLHNHLWELEYPQAIYDDRSDPPPKKYRASRSMADAIDRLIAQRHYFIVPIASENDYFSHWLDIVQTKGAKQ